MVRRGVIVVQIELTSHPLRHFCSPNTSLQHQSSKMEVQKHAILSFFLKKTFFYNLQNFRSSFNEI